MVETANTKNRGVYEWISVRVTISNSDPPGFRSPRKNYEEEERTHGVFVSEGAGVRRWSLLFRRWSVLVPEEMQMYTESFSVSCHRHAHSVIMLEKIFLPPLYLFPFVIRFIRPHHAHATAAGSAGGSVPPVASSLGALLLLPALPSPLGRAGSS